MSLDDLIARKIEQARRLSHVIEDNTTPDAAEMIFGTIEAIAIQMQHDPDDDHGELCLSVGLWLDTVAPGHPRS